MGTEDVKVTAMNMYKYKERLRLYKRWPCSTYNLRDLTRRSCDKGLCGKGIHTIKNSLIFFISPFISL